jgi:carboxypeptidase PM20D1
MSQSIRPRRAAAALAWLLLLAPAWWPAAAAPADTAAERLAAAIRFATISTQDDADFDGAPFEAMRAWMAETYPALHRELERRILSGHSLLYTWTGRDEALPPVLLTAHLDVVPVPEETLPEWTHPPFEGVISDGFVWGRGALDDKGSLITLLEAVEGLVLAGFRPARTVYLAFGHDEEVGGERGAGAITDWLEERGVRLALSLDEGSAITRGLVPFVEGDVAAIGVAEKGYLTLEVTARAEGGHSSRPLPDGAIGKLSRAVLAIEGSPLPARLDGPVAELLDAIAPQMSWPARAAIAGRPVFAPLLARMLARDPSTAPLVRTTTAVTLVRGGVKENVLPPSATATVNFRLLPGDSASFVVDHVRRVVNDPDVEIRVGEAREASPVSATEGPAWELVSAAIRDVAPEALIVPGLVLGGTDSKHYGRIAEQAYRFVPMRLVAGDLARIHGVDERIEVANLAEMVRFYESLLRRLEELPAGS